MSMKNVIRRVFGRVNRGRALLPELVADELFRVTVPEGVLCMELTVGISTLY